MSEKRYDFRRYSQQFCNLPTQEQLDDPDNLFALVHKTKQAVQDFGYSESNLSSIRCYGFNKIVRQFVINGTEKYSKDAIDAFVEEQYAVAPHTKHEQKRCGILRKAAEILHRYYKTGEFKWFTNGQHDKLLPNVSFMELLDRYIAYCKNEKTYSESTIKQRNNVIRRFMNTVESLGYTSFSEFSAIDAKKCALRYLCLTSEITNSMSEVKAFFKYLYAKNKIAIDLTQALTVKISRRRKVFPGYEDDEIGILMNQINCDTAVGKRDYAVMQTALLTGLSGGDIASLKMTDIDWRTKEITIIQNKTGHPVRAWMGVELGSIIGDYILNGRPKSDSPYIFLRHQRPYERLYSVFRVVKKYSDKAVAAGFKIESRGLHALRRTFGIRLLRAETPLHLINEMLGHHKMDSSRPYLAADDDGLKKCALPLITAETGERRAVI
ncbi:hypothetical protein FACS1894202_13330 [Clostridia bacterium]|nr:hypothetical protein FACS1894202_13330 [Clostridia bacterium]